MDRLNEDERAKILGLNAAKMFNFDIDGLLKRRREVRASAN
jgi:hypothetical protein